MNKMPVVPLEVDVTSHLHIVHEYIHDAMCDAFHKDQTVLESKGLTNDHLDIFLKARLVKKKLASAYARFAMSKLVACFAVWKGEPWRCNYSATFAFSCAANVLKWVDARVDARKCCQRYCQACFLGVC